MAKRIAKPAKKPTPPAEPPAPPAEPPATPPAPLPPMPKVVDHKKETIARVVALLKEAQTKLASDPSAVGILLNQAIEDLTS